MKRYVVRVNDQEVLDTAAFYQVEIELVKYVHVKRAWEMIEDMIEKGRAEYACGYYEVVCERNVGA